MLFESLNATRHCDRTSAIYRMSQDNDVSRECGKLAVRLRSDTTWERYAQQGCLIHDVIKVREKMHANIILPETTEQS